MFTILSAAVAPGFALMSFFYLKDRFDSKPFSIVFRTFVMGSLLVFPIMFIQYAFETEDVLQYPATKSFLLSGGLEEFFKWFIFMYAVYKQDHFEGRYDGIVYGVSISLGFATVENILYLLANGVEVAFLRALFPVSSHALFGVMMGYYLGKAKTHRKKSSIYVVWLALVTPILLHGLYDYILEIWKSTWQYTLTPFMIILWLIALRKVKKANMVHADVIPIEQNKWKA
ncbi:intramembrane metalloprotease PrsW [Pontibacillus sp. ALD_SL1]|uniref:glutamic-type intramembrane protease PrsW n=1 Tax=Pontibacillus sp. ALD_SL1 TaxID=2777185 RepID=UPI001A978628|nr:glutamic-type intramembrane protease PrsW [Pontibacillus sp. ALD_SL1]QSS98489.1 intramembrane metalloprotease PrsW [Pontibacillus sp. ALD_SL1]